MAGIIYNSEDDIERQKLILQDRIQKRMYERPTWSEVVNLLAPIMAKIDTVEIGLGYTIERPLNADADSIASDFIEKNKSSIRGRIEDAKNELIGIICKDIT